MDEQQQRVKDWMVRYGLGTDPQARMLDLSSEVGELAKEVLKSTAYGTKPFTPTASLEEELGDCLFSLLCLSQCLGLEGEGAWLLFIRKHQASGRGVPATPLRHCEKARTQGHKLAPRSREKTGKWNTRAALLPVCGNAGGQSSRAR